VSATSTANGSATLALDLGTSTGWALNADGRIVSGTESFKPGRFEGGGMRYLRFKRWLTELKATTEGLEAIYFEEVRAHAGVDAAHAYGGFLATLTAWCEHHEIPYQGVPVGTIKKRATGKGNASKEEMIAAMRALGHAPADDNEADALALLAWTSTTTGIRAQQDGLLTSQAISERP
jgi:Holliday junction resolvasome RuvABC endonuclease subunit